MSWNDNDVDERDLIDELSKLVNNPLESLQRLKKDFSKFEKNVNDQKYQFLAMIVALYYEITKSAVLKNDFLTLMKLEKYAETIDDKKLLRNVFRYVLGAPKHGPLYERARIYARALQDAVSRRIAPKDIPDLIREANGVEELYARQKAKLEGTSSSHRRGVNFPVVDDHGIGGQGDKEDGSDEDEEDNGVHLVKPDNGPSHENPRVKEGSRSKSTNIPFNSQRDLKVSCQTEADLSEVLGAKVRRSKLLVEFNYPEGGPIEITLLDWEPA
ncbi:hypothetical protein ASG54_03185 [Aureimonas sp. Leaf460]|nr:hypothetical protein ASG62_05905 [Aureimonas sp. Leaf427]KQT81669.1 hypothetical protein ASG54_03185 [Aureimonas sp. Leaf460]